MKMVRYISKHLKLSVDNMLVLEGNYIAVPDNQKGVEVYYGLLAVSDLLKKYVKLVLVSSVSNSYPPEIIVCFLQFCHNNKITGKVIESAETEIPSPGTAYFTLNDKDLTALLKISKLLGYQVGEEIGLLSLGDSPVKRLLGLTVLEIEPLDLCLPGASFCDAARLGNGIGNAKAIRRTSL